MFLPSDVHARLLRRAALEGIDENELVERALREYFRFLERCDGDARKTLRRLTD